MANKRGSVYVAEIKTRYKEKVYTSYLLRRSYREDGKVKQQTLGNLSALPPEAIAILRGALHGQKYISDYEALQIRRSWHHGHVAAVGAKLRRLELDRLLDPLPSDVRDRLVALLIARVVAPASKLATSRWWQNTTLSLVPAVGKASTDDLYEAMDSRTTAGAGTSPGSTAPAGRLHRPWSLRRCKRTLPCPSQITAATPAIRSRPCPTWDRRPRRYGEILAGRGEPAAVAAPLRDSRPSGYRREPSCTADLGRE